MKKELTGDPAEGGAKENRRGVEQKLKLIAENHTEEYMEYGCCSIIVICCRSFCFLFSGKFRFMILCTSRCMSAYAVSISHSGQVLANFICLKERKKVKTSGAVGASL